MTNLPGTCDIPTLAPSTTLGSTESEHAKLDIQKDSVEANILDLRIWCGIRKYIFIMSNDKAILKLLCNAEMCFGEVILQDLIAASANRLYLQR